MATISKTRKRAATRQRVAPQKLSESRLRALIEEATVDSYGDDEQRMSFEALLGEKLDLPFQTRVLGVPDG